MADFSSCFVTQYNRLGPRESLGNHTPARCGSAFAHRKRMGRPKEVGNTIACIVTGDYMN